MAYGNNGGNIPQRDKNPLDNPKLKLSAPSPGAQGKWATLQVQFFSNMARLNVYSNNPNDQSQRHGGRVSLKLPMHAFGVILQLLIKAIDPNTPKDWKEGYQCKETRWKDGKPSDEPMLEGTVWVGKDQNGVVWISVVHWNKESPRIKFEFGNTIFNILIDAQGNPITDEEASRMWVKSYLDTVGEMLKVIAATQPFHQAEKKEGGGYGGGNRGGGGGGGRSYGGGGGGGNAGGGGSYEDTTDDIPF
jgi:hypothetical protein